MFKESIFNHQHPNNMHILLMVGTRTTQLQIYNMVTSYAHIRPLDFG
jgi:hypothetical protein